MGNSGDGGGAMDRLVSVREVAKVLGVSVRSVHRLVASGELCAPLKLGQSSRYLLSEVVAYLERLKGGRHSGGLPA